MGMERQGDRGSGTAFHSVIEGEKKVSNLFEK